LAEICSGATGEEAVGGLFGEAMTIRESTRVSERVVKPHEFWLEACGIVRRALRWRAAPSGTSPPSDFGRFARAHFVGKRPPPRNREATSDNRPMTSISNRLLVDAVLCVERMAFKERERLAEEIHDRQPNLFFSVLALRLHGATLEQIEMVLNLLLVFYEAMKTSGKAWPVISEVSSKRKPFRTLSRTIPSSSCSHTSSVSFGEHGLLGIESETEKMLMLAALNLVECIAETAPKSTQ
jgi:hypothetical protein